MPQALGQAKLESVYHPSDLSDLMLFYATLSSQHKINAQ